MNAKCWANVLGGCDAISHEHVVSRRVLKGRDCDCPVISQGANSMPSGRFGVDRMTSKILCKKHNRALSELDAEASRIMDYLTESKAPGHTGDLTANGFIFERWLLKTCVNSLAARWADANKMRPDQTIVEWVFGVTQQGNGYGFYTVDCDDSDIEGPRDFKFTKLTSRDHDGRRTVPGFFIRFSGVQFLFALQPNAVEMLQKFPIRLRVGLSSELTYLYRPGAIAISAPDGSVRRVRFQWPGRSD